MFELSAILRAKAVAVGAEAWLRQLPALIAAIADEWQLTIGAVFAGGTEACVVDATQRDGTPAVLKLTVPGDEDAARHEATVLRLADGVACARLLREDPERGALLLERLERKLADLGLPLSEQHAILCDTVARLWRPAPDSGLPTGAEKGRRLIDVITTKWEALDRPCSERAVDYAIGCAERRISAHDDERAVLVHGDLHQWNTLEAGGGFKLVDPDGLLADAEYDLGIVMREDPREALEGDPRARSRWLAARTGRNEHAIWEWGAVERMSTGLLNTEHGLKPSAGEMLAVAERVAAEPA